MTAFHSHTRRCTLLRLRLTRLLFLVLPGVAPAAASVHQFHELPLMLQFLLHHSEELYRVHHGLRRPSESCAPLPCEAIVFLEPRINVRSAQHCVSRKQEANANTDATRRTRTTTDALKTAVEVCALC